MSPCWPGSRWSASTAPATEHAAAADIRLHRIRPAAAPVRAADRARAAGAPLSDPTMALVDLRGAGLPDMVELGATRRFWRNTRRRPASTARGRWPRRRRCRSAEPGVQFIDADGDGRADLLVTMAANGPAGYFPMTFAAGWSRRSFQPYRQAPGVSLADPAVRLVDLDGDGLTDVLRSGTRAARAGSTTPTRDRAWQRNAPATGARPDLDLADPRVRLADMTGDGLQTSCCCATATIAYWPNLGHGRWGAPVAMRRRAAAARRVRPAPAAARRRRRRRRRRPGLRRRRPGAVCGATSPATPGPSSR